MAEPDDHLPAYEQDARRRIFWSLYLLERLAACGRYRPPAILDQTCSLRLPCEDEGFQSTRAGPTLLDLSRLSPGHSQTLGPHAKVIIAARSLSECAQHMLQPQYPECRYPPWHPQSQHAAIASKMLLLDRLFALSQPLEHVLNTKGGVLQSSSFALLFSRLLANLSQCLLYHPFLLYERVAASQVQPPKHFWRHARELSQSAADDLIDLIRTARNYGCSLTSSFSGYCVTAAATIQVLNSVSSDFNEEHLWQPQYLDCKRHLEHLRVYWPNAATMVRYRVDIFVVYER